MTDKAEKPETLRIPRQRPPKPPNYEKEAENIERWINSSGLQRPT